MTARAEQVTPPGNWNVWLVLAGRGYGKTRLGAEDVAYYGVTHPGCRIAIVAPTFGDARDTCIEGNSGLLKCLPPELTGNGNNWNRSLGELTLTNGTIYHTFSADQPDRLRGPQHHRAWCDELAVWGLGKTGAQATFDMLKLGLRLGEHPQCIITTTPKPIQLIRDMSKDASGDVYITTGTTFDNADNLAPTFITDILNKYKGTRLGEQELYAKILDEVPGALWHRTWIDETRIEGETADERARKCMRIVVAIDPATTSGEDSDFTGIIAAGIDASGRGYILADETCKESPRDWAKRALRLLERFHGDCIVAETNNGGDMVEATIRMVDENAPFRKVTASRGKYVRAEPIAALYEQKRVSHMGTFGELEDQMCRFTVDNIAQDSPDRVDAAVWACSELFQSPFNFGVIEVNKAESSKTAVERRLDMEIEKLRLSGLIKPAMAVQASACINCGSASVVKSGPMNICGDCGASWMGGSALGKPQTRSDFLMKLN